MARDNFNLKNRWKYGIIFGVGTVALFLNYQLFVVLSILATLFSGIEYTNMIFIDDKKKYAKYFMYFLMPFMSFLSGLFIYFGRIELMALSYCLLIPFLGTIGLMLYKDPSVIKEKIIDAVFGIFYISFSLSLCVFIYHKFGWEFAAITVTSPWIFDSFAFFVGIRLGKTRLMPSISPKKSVEGLIGGSVISIFGLWLLERILSLIGGRDLLEFWQVIILAVTVSVAATFGDLFESALKRYHSQKDSGHLIPGHGGLLDRIDSLLFISPCILFLLFIFK